MSLKKIEKMLVFLFKFFDEDEYSNDLKNPNENKKQNLIDWIIILIVFQVAYKCAIVMAFIKKRYKVVLLYFDSNARSNLHGSCARIYFYEKMGALLLVMLLGIGDFLSNYFLIEALKKSSDMAYVINSYKDGVELKREELDESSNNKLVKELKMISYCIVSAVKTSL